MIVAGGGGRAPDRFGDLSIRIASALVVAAVALACIWLGGWFSTVLILLAGGVMLVELAGMTIAQGAQRRLTPETILLLIGLVAGGVLTEMARLGLGVIAISFATIAAAAWSVRRLGPRDPAGAMRAFAVVAVAAAAVVFLDTALTHAAKIAIIACAAIAWVGLGSGEDRLRATVFLAGGAYISAAVVSFVALRSVEPFGFLSILWAGLIVVAADVGGYFAGRIIGGPKLWPAVSPKKTWAGMGGGVALAIFVGAMFSWATTGTYFYQVCTVSMIAAVLSQAGDLAESAVKRRFGVKDASGLIPGHGGVLDRLDGHTAAILVAAVVTFSRGQPVFVW